MVEQALKITDEPDQLKDLLKKRLGWEESQGSERRPVFVNVYSKCPLDPETPARKGLIVHFAKVSQWGSLEMEVEAERMEARDSLVGLAAKEVASMLGNKSELEELELPKNLKQEVRRMLGGWIGSCKDRRKWWRG